MNPEVKKVWLKALRSGDYEQGQGMLLRLNPDLGLVNHEEGFCCLGVLLDAIGFDPEFNANLFDGCSLPPNVQAYAGLKDSQVWELMGMNDELNLDFDQIADWIEVMM